MGNPVRHPDQVPAVVMDVGMPVRHNVDVRVVSNAKVLLSGSRLCAVEVLVREPVIRVAVRVARIPLQHTNNKIS